MKKLRKITSILCVISLLLSLCAVGVSSYISAAVVDPNIDFDIDDDKPEVEIDYGDFGIPSEDNNNVWLNMHTDNGFGEEVERIIATPGDEMPEIPTKNNEKGMGWKLENGDWAETVPESTNASREVHVYAVYPTKVYDFEKGMNDIFMPNGNKLGAFDLSTVADPLNSGRGTVVKLNTTMNMASTVQIPLSLVSGLGNSEGFKLNNGATYTISMDVYLGENNIIEGGNNYFDFYYSAYEGVGATGNKTKGISFPAAEQEKYLATNTEGNHHWATITQTFTAGVPSGRDYFLITWNFSAPKTNGLKTVVYVDNVKIVETGTKVMEYICPVINLDVMGGKLSSNVITTTGQNEKVYLPTPTKTGYIFAGWTKHRNIAAGTANNDYFYMQAEYGPTMIAIASGRTMSYYAIWAPKSVTYTFGKKGANPEITSNVDDTDVIEFNNAVTEQELTTGAEGGKGSTGLVSTYISLEDCDGDGDFELKTNVNADRSSNVYKANLAKSNGTTNDFYVLRENVTYRVTMKVKAAELRGNIAKVGVTRCFRGGFGQVNPEGSNKRDYLMVGEFYETTTGFVTVSKEFTVFGMFNTSYSGDPTDSGLGGAHCYKDCLAFVGYSGVTYVDSITVEALSYNETTMEIIGEGTADIDYSKKTVTVKPATGYKIAADGIKIMYNYHGYDYQTYGAFKATAEQIAYLRETYGKGRTVFNIVESRNQGELVYSYTGDKFNLPPSGMKFIITFIPDENISTAVVAKSVRTEKTLSSGDYRSAGLRFRSRVIDDSRIVEVGFIAAPTEKVLGDDKLEFLENGKLSVKAASSVVAYSKETGKNVVYSSENGFKDYQLIITGLSIPSGERDLRSTSFTVVSYVKYNDNGTIKYEYSEPMETSWNLVWNSYSDEVKNQFQ